MQKPTSEHNFMVTTVYSLRFMHFLGEFSSKGPYSCQQD